MPPRVTVHEIVSNMAKLVPIYQIIHHPEIVHEALRILQIIRDERVYRWHLTIARRVVAEQRYQVLEQGRWDDDGGRIS